MNRLSIIAELIHFMIIWLDGGDFVCQSSILQSIVYWELQQYRQKTECFVFCFGNLKARMVYPYVDNDSRVEARQLDAHRETLTDYLGLGISNAT